MRFWDDNRAVTVQVGAILLFATIIIAMSMYQVTIVPSENAEVEYKHSQTTQNQMTDVRNGILRSAATGTVQPASVTLGTQYPSRPFLVNPPPATGTLSTTNPGIIRLENVAASNPETNDFFESEAGVWNASTKSLSYEPDYNEYENAPTLLYESSILSTYYPDSENSSAIPLTDQVLVDEDANTITLVALNGSLSTSQAGSVSVSPEPLSAPYHGVTVRPSTGDMTLTVPTRVASNTLAARTSLSDGAVADVPGGVEITLTGTYTLRTARIGVGSGTVDPGPRYVTTTDEQVVRTGEQFTVTVRDAFNNPVTQDATVSVEPGLVDDDDGQKQVTESGTVSFTYTGSGDDVTASIPGGGAERAVVFDGRVATGGGGGGVGVGVGPNVTAATVSPGTVAAGESVTLDATVDDTSGRGGIDIARAEWFHVTPGQSVENADPGLGNGVSLSFVERNYYAIEDFTASIDTTGWQDGTHTVAVRGQDANGNWGPEVTRTVDVESTAPNAIQFNNLQNFGANPSTDEFTIGQVQIQDNDNDDDLDRVEYEITDSSGQVVATRTDTNIPGDQYQVQDYVINNTVNVQPGEQYTLTVIGYDADGNYASRSLSTTSQSPPSVTINSVTTSQEERSGKTHQVTVSFTGSDPNNDITSYTVELYDSQSDVSGTSLDSITSDSYTGGQTSVTLQDDDSSSGGGDDPYYIVVTVSDETGLTGRAETQGDDVS